MWPLSDLQFLMDLLVVGASPAGIMAAKAAAEHGSQVVLVDQKQRSDRSHPANTFFEGMMQRAGESVQTEYVVHNLRGMHIVSPAGHRVTIDAPGYSIDRRAFDKYYYDLLDDLGVDIRWGVRAHRVLKEDGQVVGVRTTEGDLHSPIVIASDGIASSLARGAGLKPMRHPNDVAWAIECLCEARGLGDNDYFEYYLGSVAPGWKATLSPRGGDRASLGVYVRRRGPDIAGFFDEYLEKIQERVGPISILERYRGGDPIATIPHEIVADGLMVAGGAAGQSGIAYGMRAGQIAGLVASKTDNPTKENLMEYRRRWAREFKWEYYLGRWSLETLRRLSDREIDRLVRNMRDCDVDDIIRGRSLWCKGMRVGLEILRHSPGSVPALLAAQVIQR